MLRHARCVVSDRPRHSECIRKDDTPDLKRRPLTGKMGVVCPTENRNYTCVAIGLVGRLWFGCLHVSQMHGFDTSIDADD